MGIGRHLPQVCSKMLGECHLSQAWTRVAVHKSFLLVVGQFHPFLMGRLGQGGGVAQQEVEWHLSFSGSVRSRCVQAGSLVFSGSLCTGGEVVILGSLGESYALSLVQQTSSVATSWTWS